jgi:hypothetical protein
MKPGLFKLMSKFAAEKAPSEAHQAFLDNHFTEPDKSKWDSFKEKLRSKSFVSAVKQDDRADQKLKRFAQSLNEHMTGKGPAYNVPSQTSTRDYQVKFHPSTGAFSCSCGDWTYARSTKASKNLRECKHITQLKTELRAKGKKLTKLADALVLRGAAAAALLRKG